MSFLQELYMHDRFSMEIQLICLLFLLPLRKRTWWGLRFLLGAVFSLLLVYQIPFSNYRYVLETVLAALVVFFTCELSIWDSLYCSIYSYAVQHIVSSTLALLRLMGSPALVDFLSDMVGPVSPLRILLFALLVVPISKYLHEEGRYNVSIPYVIGITGLVFLVTLVLDASVKVVFRNNQDRDLYIFCVIYDILCCFFLFFMRFAERNRLKIQREKDAQAMLLQKQQEQYHLSNQYQDVLNRRYHDMKYLIAALRDSQKKETDQEIANRMEQELKGLEHVYNTGNDALDTILTEKSLLCGREKIIMTCQADGHCLDFMKPLDLYIICGNAIDNAIESCQKIADPEKRMISIQIGEVGGMRMMKFFNSYESKLNRQGEEFLTTKENRELHGYGIRSIKETVNRYQGYTGITADKGIFSLFISFPMDEKSL